ncbi:MAG TPA: hypothetical protein DC049_03965 [Spirochaetia bacterium]|nr:hypothetical protein [Spirochaetia bacterium]
MRCFLTSAAAFFFLALQLTAEQPAIFIIAADFIKALKNKNREQITLLSEEKMQIRFYDKKELTACMNRYIKNEISAIDYMQIISGNNIFIFFDTSRNEERKIMNFQYRTEIYRETVEFREKSIEYFYLKGIMTVQNRKLRPAGSVISQNEERYDVEMDFLPAAEGREGFRVFGFVLKKIN